MKTLIVGMAMVLLAQPALAERYKALPTAQDNAEMDAQLKPGSEVSVDQFLKAPQDHHWVAFYEAAAKLFADGRKNEAVKWYYAGQIRGRVAAGIDPDPSRNNALLTSLNYGLGKPINEYAGRDLDNWVKQIDAALAWDKEHPLPNDPQKVIGISDVAWDSANFQAVYAEVRNGLKSMRDELAATDPAEFKRQRAANGLKD